jgi:hypothetical protein
MEGHQSVCEKSQGIYRPQLAELLGVYNKTEFMLSREHELKLVRRFVEYIGGN